MRIQFETLAWLILLLSGAMSGGIIFEGCSKGGGINIFTVEDDIKLGKQLQQEIASDPAKYPILDPNRHSLAYQHLNRMRDIILSSGKVKFKDKFEWDLKIIKDDNTLNAFCAPGGYIYVYTGLIRFLNKENELAGVLGHEIAHADLRHSTDRLTTAYGVDFLLQVLLGKNNNALGQIAGNLALLAYSRSNESQADSYSVEYLCGSEYDARGTAGFFQKLIEAGMSGGQPAFLSTHPNPENRVENINKKWQSLGCSGTGTFESRYQELIRALN
jgi:predicted Zn-dependent protease